MQLTATIKSIGSTQEVSDKFKKRELIVTYSENPHYPETLKFEATQDKVSILDGLNIGDHVEVHFNLRGREWTNKDGVVSVFNTLGVWKVVKMGQGVAPEYFAPVNIGSADDDLPF